MFKIPNSVPGFRFHPSDVQLLMYFLKRKVMGKKFPLEVITELDIYQYSPWDLPDKSCLRSGDLEWFFFSPRGKKYCSGSRTNRATNTGYWKSTGKDRAVPHNKKIVGKIKTLVFHTGKSPDGKRTNWVIHEYRLEDKDLTNQGIRQDSYVICKVFQKQGIGPRNGAQYGKPFNDQDWNDHDDDDDDVEKEIPLAAAVPILNMTSNISSPQSEQHLPAPASGCIEPTSMSTLSGPVLSPEQHLPAPASGCIEPTSMSTLSGPVLSPVSGCIEPTSMSTLSGPVLSPVSGCIEPTSMSTLSGPELSPVSGCIEPTSMSTLSGPVLSSDAASPSDPGNQDVINDDDDILTLLDLSTELEEENKLPEENIVKGEPPSDFFEGLGDLDDWAALSGLFYDKNNAANSSITKEMVTSCDMDFMELIELDSPLFCQETTPPN